MGYRLISSTLLITLLFNLLTPVRGLAGAQAIVGPDAPVGSHFYFSMANSLENAQKAFIDQAPSLGIDLNDPTVKAQYEKAYAELKAKYAQQEAVVAKTDPSAFAALIADSIKKIQGLEKEVQEMVPAKQGPYRSADVDAKAKLNAKVAQLEDEMLKLHVYLQAAEVKKLVWGANFVVLVNLFILGVSVVSGGVGGVFGYALEGLAHFIKAFLVLSGISYCLMNGITVVGGLYARAFEKMDKQDQAKYLAQVQKELKKMLEPAELKAAKEILDYVENYGCNVIAEGMQLKTKPKFRVAPEETMGAGKTKYRIEAGGSATAAEIEAAQAVEQETQKLKHLPKPVYGKP